MRALAVAAALVAVVAAWAPARAEDGKGKVTGTVTVDRPSGVEPGAILVYVVGFNEPPATTTPKIQQRNRAFVPDLIAITAGQSVAFPNGDTILHNVFSPTPSRRFDLGSYRKGESRTRAFPKAGVVDVFCNIHPGMSATIAVLPNRRFAFADPTGAFTIDGIPPGVWTVFAYSRRARAPVSMKVRVVAGLSTEARLTLEEIDRDFAHRNKYGEEYRDPDKYR
jgi:plastocyanin